MPTFKRGCCEFHYDHGFNGDVKIVLKGHRRGKNLGELIVPAHELLEFVAQCFVKPAKILRLSNKDSFELLGVKNDEVILR